jgi:FkbM family methyltransferase
MTQPAGVSQDLFTRPNASMSTDLQNAVGAGSGRVSAAGPIPMKQLIQTTLHRVGYQLNRWYNHREIMRGLLGRDDPVIFDVGASIGGETFEYRKHFPRARIHAFEPAMSSYQILQSRVSGDLNITAYNLAVSDAEGVVRFNTNVAPACSSLLPTDERSAINWSTGLFETVETAEVKAVTLDRFCEAHEIPRIDILKLDVQGAEYLVLEGARRLLSGGDILLIFAEIILVPTYKGQRSLLDYLTLFDEYGYQLVDLYDLTRRHSRLAQADFLFAAPGVLQS